MCVCQYDDDIAFTNERISAAAQGMQGAKKEFEHSARLCMCIFTSTASENCSDFIDDELMHTHMGYLCP